MRIEQHIVAAWAARLSNQAVSDVIRRNWGQMNINRSDRLLGERSEALVGFYRRNIPAIGGQPANIPAGPSTDVTSEARLLRRQM